jgi:hypothetical protein
MLGFANHDSYVELALHPGGAGKYRQHELQWSQHICISRVASMSKLGSLLHVAIKAKVKGLEP